MLAIIPFAGFYNTMHDAMLDDALDQYFQYPRSGEPCDALVERAFGRINWTKVHVAYATAYAEAFAEEFEIKGLKFDALQSPKEYNFVTDRIFVQIPRAEVRRLRRETPAALLEEQAKEMFTSRDGFISFYTPDMTRWGPLDKWDHNNVYALVCAYVKHKRSGDEFGQYQEMNLMEDYRCNGCFDNWIAAAGDDEFKRIDKLYAYLRERGNRPENPGSDWRD